MQDSLFIYALLIESCKVRRFLRTSWNFISAKSQLLASFNFPKFAVTHPMPQIWLEFNQWGYIGFQEKGLGTFSFRDK